MGQGFAKYRYAEDQYQDSLLPLVAHMTFMLFFDFARMIVLRVQLEYVDGIEFDTSMGFWQIIALVLLAITFLEATEISTFVWMLFLSAVIGVTLTMHLPFHIQLGSATRLDCWAQTVCE